MWMMRNDTDRYEHVETPEQLVGRLLWPVAVKHNVSEPQQIDIFQIEPVCEHSESVVDLDISRTFQEALWSKSSSWTVIHIKVLIINEHSVQGGVLVEILGTYVKLVLWSVTFDVFFL